MKSKSNKELVKKIVSEIIDRPNIWFNILSIYWIWSSVRWDIERINDIDLNFFIKKDSAHYVLNLNDSLLSLSRKYNIFIDSNVITLTELEFMNNFLFIHKFRHALLCYELKTYKNLLYWEDILNAYKINFFEIFFETVKITNMLLYRLKKNYLAKNWTKDWLFKESIKFFIYSCEFLLINVWHTKSFKNYYEIEEVYLTYLWKENLPKHEIQFIKTIFQKYCSKDYAYKEILLESIYQWIIFNASVLNYRYNLLVSSVSQNKQLPKDFFVNTDKIELEKLFSFVKSNLWILF